MPLPIAEATTNKAEAVRSVIQECGASGLTPAQIRQKLLERNVEASGNYLYAILLRAKKTGRILEKNGRYFAVQAEAAG